MSPNSSDTFLRRVLALDAISSGGLGILAILFAAPLAGLLALPVELLRWAGIVLMPFAAFVGIVASRAKVPRTGVWIVIGLNVLWTIESVLLCFNDSIASNALGYGFIVVQAAAVAVLAELEFIGLRRIARADSASRVAAN